MEGARADFHVVGLQHDAAIIRPVAVQGQNERLERAGGFHVIWKDIDHGLGSGWQGGLVRPRSRRPESAATGATALHHGQVRASAGCLREAGAALTRRACASGIRRFSDPRSKCLARVVGRFSFSSAVQRTLATDCSASGDETPVSDQLPRQTREQLSCRHWVQSFPHAGFRQFPYCLVPSIRGPLQPVGAQ